MVRGRRLAFQLRRYALISAAALILAACDSTPVRQLQPIEDIELPDPGTFAVTLRGAIEADFSGETDAVLAPMGRAVYLTGDRYSANLVMPTDQTVGTYNILPLLNAFNAAQTVNSIGGVLVDSEPPTTDESGATIEPAARSGLSATWYDNVVQGRVTLLSIEPMTGAFEYVVADQNGSTTTVYGVFNELSQIVDTP